MSNAEQDSIWYRRLRGDLRLLRHAEVMYSRAKKDMSQDVIWRGMYDIRRDLDAAIYMLGGLASPW